MRNHTGMDNKKSGIGPRCLGSPMKQTRKYEKMFKERYPNRDMSTDTMYVAKGRDIRDVSKKLPGFDRAGKKTGGRVVATKIAKKD
jgi:hypothetical protein